MRRRDRNKPQHAFARIAHGIQQAVLRYEKAGVVWTIEQAGAQITTTLDGVPSVETFDSELIARKRFDILAGKQTRDGWQRVKDQVVKAPPPKRKQAEAAVEDARNLDLEAAILADPTNPEPYRMYADWLEQQGDPRGRLIALELALEDRREDQKLVLLTNAYARRIAPYTRKGVIDEIGNVATWRRGFIAELQYCEGELGPKLRQTLAAHSGRFVQKIQLDDDGNGRLAEALAVIASDAPLSLRELVIGGQTSLDTIEPLAKLLPRLTRFALMSIDERGLTVAPRALAQIVTASFAKLESLHFDLGSTVAAVHLEPLFARTDLPNLQALSFRSTMDDTLIAMLAASPLAAQIVELTFEDLDSTAVLDASLGRLPALERLIIPEYDHDYRAELEKRGITVDSPWQPDRRPLLSTTPPDEEAAFDDVQE